METAFRNLHLLFDYSIIRIKREPAFQLLSIKIGDVDKACIVESSAVLFTTPFVTNVQICSGLVEYPISLPVLCVGYSNSQCSCRISILHSGNAQGAVTAGAIHKMKGNKSPRISALLKSTCFPFTSQAIVLSLCRSLTESFIAAGNCQ